jgi:hypothetical protein
VNGPVYRDSEPPQAVTASMLWWTVLALSRFTVTFGQYNGMEETLTVLLLVQYQVSTIVLIHISLTPSLLVPCQIPF